MTTYVGGTVFFQFFLLYSRGLAMKMRDIHWRILSILSIVFNDLQAEYVKITKPKLSILSIVFEDKGAG